jgi:alpha-L-fucosidase 2
MSCARTKPSLGLGPRIASWTNPIMVGSLQRSFQHWLRDPRRLSWMLAVILGWVWSTAAEPPGSVSAYNVVWDTPSENDSGSMPLGNGEVGLNAWVEPNGDLCLYLSRTDSWGDNGRLLKIGKVRFQLDPAPKLPMRPFSQTLSLADGTVVVRFGEGDEATVLRLWVDANHPAVRLEVHTVREAVVVASIELWRNKPEVLPVIEISDVQFDLAIPGSQTAPTVVEPDHVLEGLTGRIGWYHYNAKSVGPAITARIQGVADFERPDPLLGRTFGALITAEGAERESDLRLRSPAGTRHLFQIHVTAQHPSTPDQWLGDVEERAVALDKTPFTEVRKAHEDWWREFWGRSWIDVTSAGTGRDTDAFDVSRAYALQRFINACGGRGRYPIKFNGAIFTVSNPGSPGNADYRRWGPGYWWQNTRLPYFSMSASGDFDLMQPLFNLYGRELMPLFRHRTRKHVGHEGVYIPETIYFWGDLFSVSYGWTPYEQRADKLQDGPWHKWEWVSGPELVLLMLEYYEHTLDEPFLNETLLPTAREILVFFDQQYGLDDQGKLLMHPAQALETWWDCTNPMPELSGLHALTERLLALPESLTPADQRAFWISLRAKLPGLPTRVVDGKRMLAPARSYANKQNAENPELYAVFPFRLIGVGRPDLDLGLEAFNHRLDVGNYGWRQDDIFMAYLGLANPARDYLVERARTKHVNSRFPAFWGPNFDWVPDQTHGGVLLKTLQSMLLQTDGRKILLLPAWPADWNASFKLHAPFRTVLKGVIRDGKLTELEVTPPERRRDVIVQGQGLPDRLGLGAVSTNVLAGSTVSVPLTLRAPLGLTELTFRVVPESDRLVNPRFRAVGKPGTDSSVTQLDSGAYEVHVSSLQGTWPSGNSALGALEFDSLPGARSDASHWRLSDLSGIAAGTAVAAEPTPQRYSLVVVGRNPLLLPDPGTTGIVVFGQPNQTYFLDQRPMLGVEHPWTEALSIEFGGDSFRRIEGLLRRDPSGFYRVRSPQ